MAYFSGVMSVLFCIVFGLYAFVEAAALRSIALRYAGAPIATRVSFCFFPLVYLEMSLFPSIFCTISAYSLFGEYVVRVFLPNGAFLPCDHGLDFWHQGRQTRLDIARRREKQRDWETCSRRQECRIL